LLFQFYRSDWNCKGKRAPLSIRAFHGYIPSCNSASFFVTTSPSPVLPYLLAMPRLSCRTLKKVYPYLLLLCQSRYLRPRTFARSRSFFVIMVTVPPSCLLYLDGIGYQVEHYLLEPLPVRFYEIEVGIKFLFEQHICVLWRFL